MNKDVERYRERRRERIKVREDAKEKTEWITVKGAHVPIDGEGNITGPVAEKIKNKSASNGKGKMSVQKANSSIKSLIMNEEHFGPDFEEKSKKWANDLPAGATITWGKDGKRGKATKLENGFFECEDRKGKFKTVPDPTKRGGEMKQADAEFVMEWLSNNVTSDLTSNDWDTVGVKVTIG